MKKNKDLLIAFLSAVLGIPAEEFEGIEIINSELLRELAEDKKGILDGKSKGVMEMLAEKNKDIKKAYDLLKIISKDEKARMVYEAREAELRDQLTRIKSAEDKGRAEGIEEGRTEGKIIIVKNLLRMGLNIEQIAKAAEISVEKVEEIKKQMVN